jgi:hypothetical protein
MPIAAAVRPFSQPGAPAIGRMIGDRTRANGVAAARAESVFCGNAWGIVLVAYRFNGVDASIADIGGVAFMTRVSGHPAGSVMGGADQGGERAVARYLAAGGSIDELVREALLKSDGALFKAVGAVVGRKQAAGASVVAGNGNAASAPTWPPGAGAAFEGIRAAMRGQGGTRR